jgi:hypothetical protein
MVPRPAGPSGARQARERGLVTQYLLSVHAVEGAPPPAPEERATVYAAVGDFNSKLRAARAWVFAGGLEPPDTAAVVRASAGVDTVITDGPFTEGKEHIGGVWVIEAAGLDAALAWASEASAACRLPVEVRPFQPVPPEDAGG